MQATAKILCNKSGLKVEFLEPKFVRKPGKFLSLLSVEVDRIPAAISIISSLLLSVASFFSSLFLVSYLATLCSAKTHSLTKIQHFPASFLLYFHLKAQQIQSSFNFTPLSDFSSVKTYYSLLKTNMQPIYSVIFQK